MKFSLSQKSYGNVDFFYQEFYENCLRHGFIGKAQNRTHRAMEIDFPPELKFRNVLEVGSGFGDHLPFVRHKYDSYLQTDIRQSLDTRGQGDSAQSFQIADVMNLQFPDNNFDRCIATCLLLHLSDPEIALAELRRVSKNSGGRISLLVPCEPGMALRLARFFITSRKARKIGYVGYDLFNARDHVTYFLRVHKLIKYIFRDDIIKIRRMPFRIPSWNLNFYYVYQIRMVENNEISFNRK